MSKAPKGSKQSKINTSMPIFDKTKLGDVIGDLLSVANTGMITSAALAIHGASSPVVKTGSASVAMVNGIVVPVAAGDQSALVGTLPTATYGAWAFYVSQAGALTTAPMVTGTTLALALAALAVQIQNALPQPIGDQQPVYNAMLGFIIVQNATGANFVGGTTALDVANLTVTYYSCTGQQLFPIVNLEKRTLF